MQSVNKVHLLGNLGADPELRMVTGNRPVTSLRLATNESFRDKTGELQTHTEWHRVVVWGQQAENCAKYLKKGRGVYVEGKLRTRRYTDKENVERYLTEVVADRVVFLSDARAASGSQRKRETESSISSTGSTKNGSTPSPESEEDLVPDLE